MDEEDDAPFNELQPASLYSAVGLTHQSLGDEISGAVQQGLPLFPSRKREHGDGISTSHKKRRLKRLAAAASTKYQMPTPQTLTGIVASTIPIQTDMSALDLAVALGAYSAVPDRHSGTTKVYDLKVLLGPEFGFTLKKWNGMSASLISPSDPLLISSLQHCSSYL